ncbi:flavin monooxygenase-like protein [Ilyonectria robusta]|uniref:flavin monooxygenase-like protein n=1 Tax=Ilyonectria robusta TaxID=1079257 RepID=UPI001E8E066F|nr:flavin monooxygenase-like protein [Ilyonectria robusta]KAH8675115.1 flavin monooxygenase-like protein [Ilyonectria robusta]
MDTSNVRVAVVGAGPAGLGAIKAMLDEGFNVTGFERRPDAGGLWAFSENPQFTSATESTKAQLSKFMLPFTDFPMPDDFPLHPSSADLAAYYQSYAKHFDLLKRIVFNASVSSLTRTEDGTKWALLVEGEASPRVFDNVIVATGTEVTASVPEIEGLDLFKGRFLHSQEYKRPEAFAGQNVVIIGQGNTAGDCAVDLVSHSSKVYWSHRRGALVVPRLVNGVRFDSFASWKKTRVGFWASKVMPAFHRWMFDMFFSWIVQAVWGDLDPQWRLDRNAYYATTISGIVINDDIIATLRDGRVESTAGVRKIVGPRSVELDDGTVLDEVDTIIACTGYLNTLHVLDGIVNYSQPHPDVRPMADIYQGIFPLGYTDSLACLNYAVVMEIATTCRELSSMAIAQVWAGKSKLPPAEEMEAQVREHQTWFVNLSLETPLQIIEGTIEPHEWLKFVNETAGTGVYENLGWTLQGIRFAIREPRLSFMMQWGVNSPHIYRVFETGKRKAWDGARGAIKHVNHLSDIDLAEAKSKTS